MSKSMSQQDVLRVEPGGTTGHTLLEKGNEVAVQETKNGWSKVKAFNLPDEPVGWVPTASLSGQEAQVIDKKAFADLCWDMELRFGINAHYLAAVAELRSKTTADEKDFLFGPFRLSQSEFDAGRVDKDHLEGDFKPEDISSWRMQTTVFAAMTRRAEDELEKLLGQGQRASAAELLLAQMLGPQAAATLIKTPTTTIGAALQDVKDRDQLLQRYGLSGDKTGEMTLQQIANDLTPALKAVESFITEAGASIVPEPVAALPVGGGSFADKCRKFMPMLMDKFGLTKEQAAGVFGNLGYESGGFKFFHEIGQHDGQGGYGWAQWTGGGPGGRRKNFFDWCESQHPPLQPKDDESSFGFLCFELSGTYKNAITALKRTKPGDFREATRSFEENFEKAGVTAMDARYDWAQKALAALANPPQEPAGSTGTRQAGTATGGARYVAQNPERWQGRSVGTGECVAFVQEAAHAPETANWKRAGLVRGDLSIPQGAAIATFEQNGRYGNQPGRSHAAIYISQNDQGLNVWDQWKGHNVDKRLKRFGGTTPVDDGDQFYVIG
jgi:hypothetical protein